MIEIDRDAVLAGFLYEHPDTEVWDLKGRCKYWFSSDDGVFYFQRPENKVLNMPQVAYGLKYSLNRYLKEVRGV